VILDPRQLRAALQRAAPPGLPPEPRAPQAAVLALLTNRSQTHLLLIRRANRGDRWSNHLAFPGGHIDPADAGPLRTALRETHEELGLDADRISYTAELGLYGTRTGDVQVHAYAGFWDGIGPLRPNPAEVAQVIEVPLVRLMRHHQVQGFASVPAAELGDRLAYPLGDAEVWGVTARVIHHLLGIVAGEPGLLAGRSPEAAPPPISKA